MIMSATEENSSPATTPQESEAPETTNPRDLEKIEEEKLKSKYATGMRAPGGHSAFLQKRLQKGQKFFDSGDYQMAKQKGGGVKQVFANKVTTGDAIPTPETVPARKTSIIQPCNKFPATS
ncbi:cAMP-regulated phosphoprotein 19-like [Scaptodrosophila lebanonensis]|uniref:cAMP-regulated phosphoprotein 19-like n=1 Tax=Drosophila lebanonensis TaxID=7225 RepID=A0A6J2TDH2_DROLE|nr:cAMP-regulated phosphoprotein 19-like [Scaptodrosophila lebanonensis]